MVQKSNEVDAVARISRQSQNEQNGRHSSG